MLSLAFSPTDIITAIIGAGGAIALLVGIWLTTRAQKQIYTLSEAHRDRSMDIEMELSRANILLRSEPHILFVFNGEMNPEKCEVALLSGYEHLTSREKPFEQFLVDLPEIESNVLRGKVDELRTLGVGFEYSVATHSHRALEIIGRAAGVIATVRVRYATQASNELLEALQRADKNQSLSNSFRALMDSESLIAWLRDSNGELSWVSRGYALAVDAEDPTQVIKDQVELLSASDRVSLRNSLTETGKSRSRAYAIVGGKRVCIELRATMINGEAMSVIATDVSEIDVLNRKISEHSEAYRQTLNCVNHPIAIFASDQRLDFANTAYYEYWQLDEEFLATRPTDSQILDELNALRKIPSQSNFTQWKRKQLEIYSQLQSTEDWWYLPDGKTLRVVGRPHPFGGVLYLYDDQTENMDLRSQYTEVMNVQSESLNNLAEAVALFGSDGRLKLHNRSFATMWNVSSSQLQDEPHIRDVSEWCRANVTEGQRWDKVVEAVTDLSDYSGNESVRIDTKSGPILDARAIRLTDGNTLITFLDVSDTVRIEEALGKSNKELERAHQLKVDFLSRVSTKLRDPLTSVVGFSELLRQIDTGTMNPRQYEYIDNVLVSANELRSLIDDTIDLATMDAGLLRLEMSSVSLHAIFSRAIHSIGSKINEKQLRIEPQFSVEAMRLEADGERLQQVFKHLLANAVAFSPVGGKIQYGTRIQDGKLVAWVQDFGEGIDPTIRDVLFDRFNGRPVDPNHRGAGLGLSLVQQFMAIHGGTVYIDSEKGMGTCVECRFPAVLINGNTSRYKQKANDDELLNEVI